MIYFVTNRHLNKDQYLQVIQKVLSQGVDGLILREKDLDYKNYLSLAKKVKLLTDRYKTPLIINGSLELANELSTDGYHSTYREFLEDGKSYKFQGVSIHNIEEALKVERLGADYILAGHIFETKSKEGLQARGLDFIRALKKEVDIPIIAIGGINHTNIELVRKTGIKGAALMSYFMKSKNIEYDIKNLKKR